MILNHIWGFYTHPKKEWQRVAEQHESLANSVSHTLIIALIPALCAYYSAVFLGWEIGVGDPLFMTTSSALTYSVAMYLVLVAGVLALALMTQWMANNFGSTPTFTQSLEVAAYTATPLFMVGLAAFYPHLWFIVTVGFFGLGYSVYMLYTGVPIMMGISEERGFIYASSMVTVGLCFLVASIAATVLLWSQGFHPVFIS